jgi:threonine-phosphate decarboxylase
MTAAHGGRVYAVARRLGVSIDQIIDFSSNINPEGVPSGVRDVIERSVTWERVRAYPDESTFVSAVAAKHDIPQESIVVGNGSAALMFAILRALAPSRVLLLEPGFDEYLRACLAVDADVERLLLTEANEFAPDFAMLAGYIKENRIDVVILNSPHNPTGNLYTPEDLLALIELAEAHQVAVLLDEAFIDYAPQFSLVRLAPERSRLIVLRSLTKFYAMAGLRIGYAACGPELSAAIGRQIEAWPISNVALEAGSAVLSEDKFESESLALNAQSREIFADALRGIGLTIFPSAANFLLARLPAGSGTALAQWLEPRLILIRECASFRGLGDQFIRLAVRSHQDNERLVKLIGSWLQETGGSRTSVGVPK